MTQMASMFLFTLVAMYTVYRVFTRQYVSDNFVALCLDNALWVSVYDSLSIMGMYVGTKVMREVCIYVSG